MVQGPHWIHPSRNAQVPLLFLLLEIIFSRYLSIELGRRVFLFFYHEYILLNSEILFVDFPFYLIICLVNRPLKVLRAFYIFSAMWLIGRYAIFPFYGTNKHACYEQEETKSTLPAAESSSRISFYKKIFQGKTFLFQMRFYRDEFDLRRYQKRVMQFPRAQIIV